MIKVVNVVGARPNFMKIGPLLTAMRENPLFEPLLVHTGQHYDQDMAERFFDQLELPRPDVDLGVGSASHAQQTAEIMRRFEPLLLKEKPRLVLVVGDVNSTIACALVASKLNIKVAHVEAGLRSFDRAMPEEINRLLTDAVSDFLFTTEASAYQNLRAEGVPGGKIFFAGNVMIDTLLKHKARAECSPVLEKLGLRGRDGAVCPYALLTLHRPSNVDDRESLAGILYTLKKISAYLPVVFPVHPRTGKQIAAFGLSALLKEVTLNGPCAAKGIFSLPPLGYLEFLRLMSHSAFIMTDSGGIQEESTVLGVPCLTLRENTERPVTITEGTNTLVGKDGAKLLAAAEIILDGSYKKGRLPEKWDGQAALRIVKVLEERLAGQV